MTTANPRPVALYARVSTSDQHAEVQLHQLHAYASRAGGPEPLVFIDKGVSGSRGSRPALDRLMAAARLREVGAVVVVKLDRLARSVRHLTQLAEELEALDVGLVVLDQAIDTTTPSGRLLFHVLSSIAEFERDLIRERTKAGLDAARRRGKRLGRPPVTDRRTRDRIRRLRTRGQSIRAIAAGVGVSHPTVLRVLRASRGT